MTNDTVKLITLHLSALQKTLKENGLIFAVSADDAERSCIAFLDKKQYFANGKKKGIMVSLTELNRELL